ncbi:hypothetical protein D3C73_1616690 [compost metagenome]
MKHAVRIPQGAKMDVLLSGLGWITATGTVAADLVIWAPKGVKVAIRPALI